MEKSQDKKEEAHANKSMNLTLSDRLELVETLLNAPEPNARLQKAAERWDKYRAEKKEAKT